MESTLAIPAPEKIEKPDFIRMFKICSSPEQSIKDLRKGAKKERHFRNFWLPDKSAFINDDA